MSRAAEERKVAAEVARLAVARRAMAVAAPPARDSVGSVGNGALSVTVARALRARQEVDAALDQYRVSWARWRATLRFITRGLPREEMKTRQLSMTAGRLIVPVATGISPFPSALCAALFRRLVANPTRLFWIWSNPRGELLTLASTPSGQDSMRGDFDTRRANTTGPTVAQPIHLVAPAFSGRSTAIEIPQVLTQAAWSKLCANLAVWHMRFSTGLTYVATGLRRPESNRLVIYEDISPRDTS
jgi:hypothetical protein